MPWCIVCSKDTEVVKCSLNIPFHFLMHRSHSLSQPPPLVYSMFRNIKRKDFLKSPLIYGKQTTFMGKYHQLLREILHIPLLVIKLTLQAECKTNELSLFEVCRKTIPVPLLLFRVFPSCNRERTDRHRASSHCCFWASCKQQWNHKNQVIHTLLCLGKRYEQQKQQIPELFTRKKSAETEVGDLH